ncbi:ABC transporter substrate-binding protein [Paraburkholderia caballeronis]|uniref:Dipeptide transport system substrate-binding protein n=1 Tax=Paraburkholderia caballeronis TaxID=416943 RepID=A0A1H7HUR7_9BURK|nr:ABC transporter substrate-binding protein [Paraburkholderia caballeronis]PXW29427.1 dipeptide transport system substrate-binding protein [Paraburkholderia caballeronis]PXX04686.1 dipeptide transport system substrate-binding protein [Paraburkholderia caballeronis]RAK05747.1 dipeptide transport system substrate-binding protein [Paraburkholderia caballeronis]SED01802.1 dipeptide transport system substrate-binding protein [Paraburkholderia caballeronis]SEK51945.1 dipeptide transport system subs
MRFTLSAIAPAALAAALAVAAAPALAKPLTVCTESSPDGFDVVQFNSLVTTNASADVIFNSLVAYDEAAKKVVPSLADKWDVSADGLTYTFHLRPNVPFQTTAWFKPTRPFDADDVVFTFARMLDPDNPWHKVTGASGFPHAQSMGLPKLIKSVSKVDDHTVKFVLSEPNATFLSILTMGFASIYPAEYADQLLKAGKPTDLNAQPVGTGPFVLKSYTKDAVIRYDVNPSYWGPKPKVDRLIYAITPDAAVRAQKVKAGECQIALSPKPQDVAAAKGDSALRVVQTPAFMTAFVALNTQKKPLDNPKVRQALNMAFDRTTYLKTVFDNTATPATNPWPPITWGYNHSIQPYPYDVAKAKQLLASAGFPNGFATTIWVRPNGSVLNPNPRAGAELLQADFAKIGVKADIKVIEWGELIKEAKQGQHDTLFMGWAGDNGDPDNYLSPLFSCNAVQSGINFARFCDTQLDKLIADGKATPDIAKRTKAYEAAQKIIHDQALWIPLGYPVAAAITRANVGGYQVSPFGRQNFAGVSVQ